MNWLAPRIGVSQSAISVWKIIPAERARDIEEVTGIPRHLLRPDLWEPPWQSEPRRSVSRNNIRKAKKPQDATA
jgi:DNA-binding transcriptional regulator YdaS (Cro superfamily)